MLGISLALAAAALWGVGDLSGGLGVRRAAPFAVLMISAFSGLVVLGVALVFLPETLPTSSTVLWALVAGTAGALGITALYTGLARGRVAVVAPTTAVVGGMIPLLFGLITQGLLQPSQLWGMVVALAGLWLVSGSPDSARSGASGFVLGLLAGLGVSGFLICIAQAQPGSVLGPLLIARIAGIAVGLIVLTASQQRLPRLRGNGWALLAGVFDAGGNVLYLLAVSHIRIDLAAVLSSLYPAVTVLLAMRFLHQKVASRQWLGVTLCLAGVGLISW